MNTRSLTALCCQMARPLRTGNSNLWSWHYSRMLLHRCTTSSP